MPSFTRHILTESTSKPSALTMPIDRNKYLVNYKALVYRSTNEIEVKVGLFGSGSRIGQSVQAVGSMAIPGDYSDIRSPVRSRVYSALTPGGGGRGIPGRKPTRGYRCSEGFQFGGRFTDANYSTCGRRLFDIANLGRTIGDAVAATTAVRRMAKPAGQNINATPITGTGAGRVTAISRQPEIPRVGGANVRSLNNSVEASAESLLDKPDQSSYLIRRDGYVLQPVVSAAVLRTVPDNRNMEGATYMMAVSKPDSIGGDELGLLSNTGVTSVQYVLPNGSRLSLQRSRALTTGERRKLGRTVNEAASLDVSIDPAARLKAVADASNGGITYSEDFPGIDKPNDVVSVGGKKNVRRWVAESFNKSPKKLARVNDVAKDDSKLTNKISDVKKATSHLNDNGDIADISPTALSAAMRKTNAFESRKLNDGIVFHERADGKAFFEVPSNEQFEHLGAKVASDVQKQLGLNAPAVHLMGSGTRRPYLLEHPRNGIGERSLKGDLSLSSVEPNDMTALALADWLVDERMRTPGNIVPFKSSTGDGAMAASNRASGLAGLSKAQMSQRQKLGLDGMFNDARRGVYSSAFAEITANQRKLLIQQLDKLIKSADSFNWDEYFSRLTIDGELSAAEKAHLKIIQSIYQSRLETVRTSKERFLKAIGAK